MLGVPDYEGEDVRDFNWIEFTETEEESATNESVFQGSDEGQKIVENFYDVVDCTEFQGPEIQCSRLHHRNFLRSSALRLNLEIQIRLSQTLPQSQ